MRYKDPVLQFFYFNSVTYYRSIICKIHVYAGLRCEATCVYDCSAHLHQGSSLLQNYLNCDIMREKVFQIANFHQET